MRIVNDFMALDLTHPSTSVTLQSDLGFNRLLSQVNDLLSQRQVLLAGHDVLEGPGGSILLHVWT